MNSPLDRRESSDTYFAEIVRDGPYRVILCRDGIQWIIQRRTTASGNASGDRWVAEHYLTTRSALARLWQAKDGVVSPLLLALPERIQVKRKVQ
jgi:hypothetical protein